MATPTEPLLTEEQRRELARLLEQVDSVELKLTVPDYEQRATVRSLGLDPLQAEIRQVFFFDTPDLALYSHGVVVRARRSQKKGDDTVVKLRPVDPEALPKSLRRSPSFSVEVDASPTGFVCSGSMKGAPPAGQVWDMLRGRKQVRKLFSKEQRALYDACAPAGVALDDLAVLGPIFVLKLRSSPKGFDRKLVTELWLYPDGSRILELSTKCKPDEAFDVAAETRSFLTSTGIDLGTEQETKTRTALEFFSRDLAAAAAQPAALP
jgi:hypothetical protein